MRVFIANSHKKNTDILIKYLREYDEEIELIGHTTTYQETLDFITKNASKLDVVFFSANLENQPSFNISDNLSENCGVIFTSAEKQHAYDALKANVFGFVLEPFNYVEVENILNKWKSNFASSSQNGRAYKKRFIIKFGDKIQFRKVDEISYIYAEGKMAYIITKQPTRKYIIDYTLDELEKKVLDPTNFYRINRKYIISIDSIEEARHYVNSRLKLILNTPTEADMIVSREKVNDFKRWLNL